jgi:hypothetical protein
MKKLYKRLLGEGLALVMALALWAVDMPSAVQAAEGATGYGSNGQFLAPIGAIAEGSIPISNRAGLEAIRDNLGGTYHLVNDIDLAGEEWVPIGLAENYSDFDNMFTGTFDGQGYVIRNLTISGNVPYKYAGLFGYAHCTYSGSGRYTTTNYATIKNVGLEGTNINIINDSTAAFFVGGICGYARETNFINCYNMGNVSAAGISGDGAYNGMYVSGIVSVIDAYSSWGSIKNCYNTGNVSATSDNGSAFASGIGAAERVSYCHNTGNVSATAYGSAWASGIGSCAIFF